MGEGHLPSPSSNSFFDWLLTLTSLPGAACSVQWKSPSRLTGDVFLGKYVGNEIFWGPQASVGVMCESKIYRWS